jgi:hypothetical protein
MGGVVECAGGGDGHEGAEARIETLNAGEEELGDVARAHFLTQHHFAQFLGA